MRFISPKNLFLISMLSGAIFVNFNHCSALALEQSSAKEEVSSVASVNNFIVDDLKFHISGPKDWFKFSDVTLPKGTSTLVLYKKFEDRDAPIIGITKDSAPVVDKIALDFTLRMKNILSSRSPDMSFEGPYEVSINGRSASRMQMRKPNSELIIEWYQFLEKGIVITFNYANLSKDFEADHNTFKEVVNSFSIEE